MGFYIIEIKDKYKQVVLLSADGELYCKDVAGLMPYTEPDLEQVRKEAYDKGYADAKGGYENGFENGMIVAWDAATKIGNMSYGEEEKVFGSGGLAFIEKHTAAEAIEKLKTYELKHEGIKVGEEVKDDKDDTGVCTEISYPANSMHIMYADGTATDISLTGVTKTGRYFPEIVTVLEKLKECETDA